MSFCDLNVSWSPSARTNRDMLATAIALGWHGLAWNATIPGAALRTHAPLEMHVELGALEGAVVPANQSGGARVVHGQSVLRVEKERREFVQKKRLTLLVESDKDVSALATATAVRNHYDIIAVRPATEKILQQCLQHAYIDIISFDFSQRLPFFIKRPVVSVVLSTGVALEISIGSSLREPKARKYLVSHAHDLLRHSRGRNIIFTSDARRPLQLRSPYDILNLADMVGLKSHSAKACITSAAHSVILHGETRTTTLKGVVRVTESDGSSPAAVATAAATSAAASAPSAAPSASAAAPSTDDDGDTNMNPT